MRRPALLLALLAALAPAPALTACDVGEDEGRPAQFGDAGGEDAPERGGFADFALLSVATTNTTRLGGADAATDAAGVASAAFPATSPETRPNAVVLVDAADWQSGIAASVLAGPPISAPILLATGDDLPEVSRETLDRLQPKGSDLARDAQVIGVGPRPRVPEGLKSTTIGGRDIYEVAANIDRFSAVARGERSPNVIIASAERPAFAMPAAAWAARSGDAVLLAPRDRIPPPTAAALRAHERPNIYILGPDTVISDRVERQLRDFGRVRRIAGPTPVDTAIAFARYRRGRFGWGVTVPGYHFTVVNAARPLDAAAAAPLGTNGIFAPLLVTDRAETLPRALESYFLDVRPGFERDPRTAVYNHVWVLGDREAISAAAQGRLDEIARLIPVERRKP